MSRYIDADALREKMYHEAFEKDTPDQKWDSGCWIRFHLFEDAIESIPSADVVEVKHGKWVKNEDRFGWHCSCCGVDDLYAYSWNSETGKRDFQDNYCPNCGAQMDGRNDDEQIH